MLENLEGASLEDQFSLAEEDRKKAEEKKKKIQELIKVRDEVIKELEKKYNFALTIQLIEKIDSLTDILREYIEEDSRSPTKSVIREKVFGKLVEIKTECMDFHQRFRDG